MAFKFKKGCYACAVIREEGDTSRLYKLVNDYWLKKMTLKAIHEEYQDRIKNYLSLRNHAIKHQHPAEKVRIKHAERALHQDEVYRTNQVVKKHQDLTQEVITKVLEGIESGEIQLTATHGLNAAKIQATVEEKQKDRSMEVFKMMAKFQSGELTGDSTTRLTDGTD